MILSGYRGYYLPNTYLFPTPFIPSPSHPLILSPFTLSSFQRSSLPLSSLFYTKCRKNLHIPQIYCTFAAELEKSYCIYYTYLSITMFNFTPPHIANLLIISRLQTLATPDTGNVHIARVPFVRACMYI